MTLTARHILARFLVAKSDKKRMVIMMGPPAAGKGFFLGEPPPKYGWKLPKMLVDHNGDPLLTDEDIPDSPDQDESDNHLRAIQHAEALKHHKRLRAAHKEGKLENELADYWYDTKDGSRVKLADVLGDGELPESFKDFFDKTNKDFYVSMRGWHDDASHENEETGKPKERFKDLARHRFDSSVRAKIEKVQDLLIVDSAGEDIDAQDFKGQIEAAKDAGYEVTVIFLHPEQADTELSNLARGKVMGKRMVDQSDIANWYVKNEAALKDIQSAQPHNFVHYRKGPPNTDPEKAAEKREHARELMNRLSKMEGPEREKAKREINGILYEAANYKLHPATSYGVALSGLPKKPEENIASAVGKMNEEAARRAKAKPEPKDREESADKDTETSQKPAKDEPKKPGKSRMNFLSEMGDQKVPNPNPDSRASHPQVKIRSLDWKYQKPHYDRWRARAASVLTRYLQASLKMAEEQESEWLQDWMSGLASEINDKVKPQGYKLSAKAGEGPEVFVTIKGGSEDATTAREVKAAIAKILHRSIEQNTHGILGFKHMVRSYNRGADLVLECSIIFP